MIDSASIRPDLHCMLDGSPVEVVGLSRLSDLASGVLDESVFFRPEGGAGKSAKMPLAEFADRAAESPYAPYPYY